MSDGVSFLGTYTLRVTRGGVTAEQVARNTLTWQAADLLFGAGLASKTWVVGFKVGGEGSALDTAQAHPWTRAPHALDGSRPSWTPQALATGLRSNRLSPARLTVEQDLLTDGIYIESSDGAVLLSVAEWYATQEMLAGDAVEITYELEAVVE